MMGGKTWTRNFRYQKAREESLRWLAEGREMHVLEEGPVSMLRGVDFASPEWYSHYTCEMEQRIQSLEVWCRRRLICIQMLGCLGPLRQHPNLSALE